MKLRLARCRWLRGYPSQNSCDCTYMLLLTFYLTSLAKVWVLLSHLWLVWFCTEAYNISNAGHIKKKNPHKQTKTYHVSKKAWKRFFQIHIIKFFISTSQTEARSKSAPPTWKWCRKSNQDSRLFNISLPSLLSWFLLYLKVHSSCGIFGTRNHKKTLFNTHTQNHCLVQKNILSRQNNLSAQEK